MVGLVLMTVSAPLFVILGALTALGYVLFGDMAEKYGIVEDGSIVFTHLPEALSNVTLMESARELTDKPPLLAIPFFVLSGAIMSHGVIATRLVNVARATFAFVPGGLGIATVAACMFFAAISGSSPVTVITIGGVMYPALVAAEYRDRFATGLVTSAGTLGILIPPSIPMIVYAIFASGTQVIQVEELFLAGLGPGLVIGGLLSGYCLIEGLRKGERFTRPEFAPLLETAFDGFWSLMLPVVILGGIYSGLFTATEAAAISVVYSLIVELFIHRELKIEDLPDVVAEAAILMGSLLIIFAMAVGLNHLLSDLQAPEAAARWIMSFDLTPFTFLLVLNGFLLLVGCLMDIMSAIMILVPLLAPMAILCGVDPIHLGIIFIVNLELGYLTPPMGLNLFVSSSIFEKSLGEVIKSVLPFTGILLVAVFLVTYLPVISLGPINVLKGRDLFTPFPQQAACETPAPDEDEDDDEDEEMDSDAGAPSTKSVKSISDLMRSKAYQDALDDEGEDDDEDEDEEDADQGTLDPAQKAVRSIGDLMRSKAYQDAIDDDEEDEDEEDAGQGTLDPAQKAVRSIGDLMRSKAYRDAIDDDEEDEETEVSGKNTGVKSVSDLMGSKAYKNALGEKNDEKDDTNHPAEAPERGDTFVDDSVPFKGPKNAVEHTSGGSTGNSRPK